MLTFLIVDDEKLERNGIKFLLNKEKADFRILEAENGKDAVGVLATEHVDILFSDVKMPYMNGLELARQAKEMNPDIEIVIFSGYNDFFYAKEALKYGVVDYVLKPVDPDEFHKTLERIFGHILQRQEKEKKRTKSKDYLTKYFLINYLFTGSEALVNKLDENLKSEDHVLQRCTRMILVSSSNSFFDTEEEHFTENLKEEIQREFYYVNLDSNEALFLFTEKYSDYEMLAEHIYHFFSKQYESECYFAVSRPLEGWREMPVEFRRLEKLLEEQFYQPDHHVFMQEENAEMQGTPEEDSRIMEQITKDIRYKDIAHIRQDFEKLEQKYRRDSRFSEMYVKFVFASILKEIYEQISTGDEKVLSKKIDRLYRCKKLQDVLDIVSRAIDEFEEYIKERENGFREEITAVKSYIHHHYGEQDIGAEKLASLVYLSPGYLSAVFKEETGVTLNRYIREVRMNKAKELLENTNMKISQIAREIGISNNSYFSRSFREFFGCSPESCRKGMTDEDTDAKV